MKNFYRGGRGLSYLKRLSHLFRSKNNRSRTLFSFVLSLICVLFSDAQAQSAGERAVNGLQGISPLEVGNTVPPEFWTKSVHILSSGVLKHTTLEHYKGKPLLIDFWNTWCTTCIAHMPELYSTELYKSGAMDILLVTPEDGQLVKKFLANSEILSGLPLISLVDNKWMAEDFYHKSVPYYVFIGSNGLVQATFGLKDMNLEMLSELVEHPAKTFTSELTNDIHQWPILLASRYSDPASYHYSFFARGENLTYGRANIKRFYKERVYSMSMLNVPYWTLFNTLASVYYSEKEYPFHHSFVSFQDSIRIAPFDLCTFEIAVPKGSVTDIVVQSTTELNMRLGTNIHFDDREIEFWEVYDDKKDQDNIDWGEIGKFSILATDLADIFPGQPLFIDVSTVTISIPTALKGKSINDLRKWLRQNHLGLRKVKKTLPILIIE